MLQYTFKKACIKISIRICGNWNIPHLVSLVFCYKYSKEQLQKREIPAPSFWLVSTTGISYKIKLVLNSLTLI